MGMSIFKETWMHMLRNRKNRLTIVLVFCAIIFYSFFFVSQKQSYDTIDYEKLEINRSANKGLMEDARATGNFKTNSFTGQSAYNMAKYNYDYQNALIESINSGNADRYVTIISTYLPEFHVKQRDELYRKESLYPGKDLIYDNTNFLNRIASYDTSETPLTFSMIQEKTSWQQLQLFLLDLGPLILVALALFLVSDVFTQNIKKRTQRIGVPLGWGKYLLVQSLAAFTFIFVFFVIAGVLFFILNGLLYGFGDINWQVPQFHYSENLVTDLNVYRLMRLKDFFLWTIPFLVMLVYLFIRLSALFSLIFRQEVVVFLAGIFIFLFERLYFSRDTRRVLGIGIDYFPQTYFDFGKVITGEKNFLINTGAITVEKGLLVLFLTLVVTEIILAAVAYKRTRQSVIG